MINNAVKMTLASEATKQSKLEVVLGGAIDLEEAADALLASAGAIGREHGIYTDQQLFRKMRDENRNIPEIDESAPSQAVVEFLFEKQLEELIDLANLSSLQEICFRLHIGGLNLKEIAKSLEISSHAMITHMRIARRRVRTASAEGKYAGWYEVYLSEIRRSGYRQR